MEMVEESPAKPAAARESAVHHPTGESTDALLQKILVRDEPIKVDKDEKAVLVGSTWRMGEEGLQTFVIEAIISATISRLKAFEDKE